MWTKQLTIRKGPDSDVVAYKLFRNNVLVSEGPLSGEEVTVTDTVPDDGEYAWHATLSDGTNESGISVPVADRLDHLAPAVTIDPLPSQVLNTLPFEVSASAIDNLGGPLTIRAEFNGVSLEMIEGSIGSWTVDPVGMAPGVYTLRVYAQDQNGLEGEASVSVELVLPPVDGVIDLPLYAGKIVQINGQRITL
jgi:hypothetical protein